MDEIQTPDFASQPPQKPKPLTQLDPKHEFSRFAIPKDSFKNLLEALNLPSEPPSTEEWSHKQIELKEAAQKNLADAQAQLDAKLAQNSQNPEQFLDSLVNNLGGILTRAGWRIPQSPATDTSLPPNPSPGTSGK